MLLNAPRGSCVRRISRRSAERCWGTQSPIHRASPRKASRRGFDRIGSLSPSSPARDSTRWCPRAGSPRRCSAREVSTARLSPRAMLLCDHRAVRVRRSFCFVDLSGFTAMTEASGDEQAVAVLTGFRAAVRDTCSRRGVRIAKWLGDGAMLVSVETTPVVAAALELLHRTAEIRVAVRFGITTGRVILLEGDDYIGHSVNVAARLCDIAGANEVLAIPDLVPHLPPWVTVLTTADVAVRGLEHPVEVVRLGLGAPSDGHVSDPVCGIPLTSGTAVEIRADRSGGQVLLCSESCLETWLGREGPR